MDWDVKVTDSMLTDAAGLIERIQWGGPTGITLEVFYSTGGEYRVSLTQRKDGAEPYSSHVTMDLIPSISLVREIGALIAAGDLRNHARAAKVLHTIFKSMTRTKTTGVLFPKSSVASGLSRGDLESLWHTMPIRIGDRS